MAMDAAPASTHDWRASLVREAATRSQADAGREPAYGAFVGGDGFEARCAAKRDDLAQIHCLAHSLVHVPRRRMVSAGDNPPGIPWIG